MYILIILITWYNFIPDLIINLHKPFRNTMIIDIQKNRIFYIKNVIRCKDIKNLKNRCIVLCNMLLVNIGISNLEVSRSITMSKQIYSFLLYRWLLYILNIIGILYSLYELFNINYICFDELGEFIVLIIGRKSNSVSLMVRFIAQSISCKVYIYCLYFIILGLFFV